MRCLVAGVVNIGTQSISNILRKGTDLTVMECIQEKHFAANAAGGADSQEDNVLIGTLELPNEAIVAEKQVRGGYVALI